MHSWRRTVHRPVDTRKRRMSMQSNLDRGGNRWLWSKTRKFILVRDNYRCQLNYAGICTIVATEVDHKRGRAVGGGDEHSNLRSVCHPCHVAKGLNEPDGSSGDGRSPSRYSYGASRVVTRRY